MKVVAVISFLSILVFDGSSNLELFLEKPTRFECHYRSKNLCIFLNFSDVYFSHKLHVDIK